MNTSNILLNCLLRYVLCVVLIANISSVEAQTPVKNHVLGMILRLVSKSVVSRLNTLGTPVENQTLVKEIVAGETSVLSDIFLREVFAQGAEAARLATLERNGPLRVGMDTAGTIRDIVLGIESAYEVINKADDEARCNTVRIGAYALGSLAGQANLLISDLISVAFITRVSGENAPIAAGSAAFMALYMILAPLFKAKILSVTDNFQGCAGTGELYDLAGDFVC